jgi:hypothetical protein
MKDADECLHLRDQAWINPCLQENLSFKCPQSLLNNLSTPLETISITDERPVTCTFKSRKYLDY